MGGVCLTHVVKGCNFDRHSRDIMNEDDSDKMMSGIFIVERGNLTKTLLSVCAS